MIPVDAEDLVRDEFRRDGVSMIELLS